MRDIKFRAYDKKLCIILPYEEISGKKSQYGVRSLLSDYLQNPDYEVMQFTGLKDKNGKEIYEGDIITTTTKNPTIMKWENKGVVEYVAPSFAIYCGKDYLKDDEPKLYTWFQYNENFEVIGNIYETPHLMISEQSPERIVETDVKSRL